MKCVICKQGETRPGTTTVTIQRGDSTVIFKGVPADVCENCGEYYLLEDITRQLFQRAEEAVQKGAEVEILRWRATSHPIRHAILSWARSVLLSSKELPTRAIR
ncbi:MAG: type II toxin-antitoxin system MqsA family antitoxin [Gammaproteobacteria bacterium]|nr:type II toxin-antitoxin system MqsA family antitoxin [Gammaproteobacteria bacterium]